MKKYNWIIYIVVALVVFGLVWGLTVLRITDDEEEILLGNPDTEIIGNLLTLEGEIADLGAEKADLENELNDVTNSLNAKTAELENSQNLSATQVTALIRERDNLQTRFNDLDSRFRDLQSRYSELEARYEETRDYQLEERARIFEENRNTERVIRDVRTRIGR